MSSRKPPPAVALLSAPEDAEAQFYEALQAGDIDKLMAVWADEDEVVWRAPRRRAAHWASGHPRQF